MPVSSTLRQQIDDLALRFLVRDPAEADSPGSADWRAMVGRIQDQAAREIAPDVAAIASEILGLLEADVLGGESDRVQEGLLRLQEAADRDRGADQAPPQSIALDPELLKDFILETGEHLASIEAQALVLERDPHDEEVLHSAFRGFHTIKGLAGFMELHQVQDISHHVEAILDRARNHQMTLDVAAIDCILQAADYIRRWTAHLDLVLAGAGGAPPDEDAALISRIQALLAGTPAVEATADLEALAASVTVAQAPPETSTDGSPAEAAAAPVTRRESQSIKVDTAKLDALVDMAGELVVAESLVRHDADLSAGRSPAMQRKMAQLTRITGELQKTAMAMRLVPIGPLFHRMARLVRDLSRQFGKRVEIETHGDNIELDRRIVEELGDPLMHMVRNSLDHGIESPQDREQCGKPPVAHVVLKAQHQSGHVVIEVSDDGRGLDRERIRAKALDRGLIQPSATLSDSEVYSLIFEPGFSTASQVTNVSGRGVGMDVVRRHIEKLRGRIEIQSTTGRGATFFLKLPLTLAIIDGLVVGVGDQKYIVPLFAVHEMFRPQQETIWTVQGRAEAALVRGSLLPVVRLYKRFGVIPKSESPLEGVLIVSEAEGRRFCLLVDELIGKQEVVIKSLGETFQQVSGVAGGAILGDGRVGLILDIQRLYRADHGDATL